ncbi:hypothetical protein GH714_041503 [Hevea brasiliensis]|uniref:Glucose-6-phosphate dehydrogenase NAD-binding domain-containing protein n=1 Tax=Hevea brasiliensis TaxID=3981 RepID=A0A6A6MQK0_HEVBR|nr:hypothetical protein GH714_041503 [Hevea brasiliensis]
MDVASEISSLCGEDLLRFEATFEIRTPGSVDIRKSICNIDIIINVKYLESNVDIEVVKDYVFVGVSLEGDIGYMSNPKPSTVALMQNPLENKMSFKNVKDRSLFKITSAEELKEKGVGASGHLAKKKIFPVFFALYCEDGLLERFAVFGSVWSKMTDVELRNIVSKTLTCIIDKRENYGENMNQFLKRCFYDLEENLPLLKLFLKRIRCKIKKMLSKTTIHWAFEQDQM